MSQPSAKASLAGWHVWVSRPGAAANALADAIAARGGEPLIFPVLRLIASPDDEPTLALLGPDQPADLAVFASIPAARHALQRRPREWWSDKTLLAVGAATKRWLASRGLSASCPEGEANSEALLALPELQDVNGKRILLPCAPGGRQLLIDSLRQRGADARAVHVYRRELAQSLDADLAERFRQAGPMLMLLATSVTILEQLQQLGTAALLSVQSLPLVTASTRIAERADRLGFNQQLTSAGASNAALLQAVEKLAGKQAGSGANPVDSDSI